MTHEPLTEEPRWAGVREVMAMSWPIILGSMSYTLMEFTDKWMVSTLGTASLAAVGAASLWSYTLSTFVLGVVGCVSTFVSQSIGRGQPGQAGAYAWQAIWLSLAAGILAVFLWPASAWLFAAMNHAPEVQSLELDYFRTRLFGYIPLVWGMGLSAFFQAINRSSVPMYVALFGNGLNIGLNYLLIFGNPALGVPEMGVTGAAWATVISQFVQVILLQAVFLSRAIDRLYNTRATWRVDVARARELLAIGLPAGGAMLVDICNWAIFVGFIVGYFGPEDLAANNVAISFMQVSFMPAYALNQGIAPIVGQWIGRGDIARAKARTYTAVRLGIGYMLTMGLIVAFWREGLVGLFSKEPAVIALGGKLLILAAVFQAFDAINIVLMGALRGAGDTRWIMVMTFITAYFVFIPMASFCAIWLGAGAFGAWTGAAIYIVLSSALFYTRFRGERWRDIRIFREDRAPAA
jgi:MATE family multidrug resistance protein